MEPPAPPPPREKPPPHGGLGEQAIPAPAARTRNRSHRPVKGGFRGNSIPGPEAAPKRPHPPVSSPAGRESRSFRGLPLFESVPDIGAPVLGARNEAFDRGKLLRYEGHRLPGEIVDRGVDRKSVV